MLQTAPLARMVPVQFKARGAPAALVPGWRYFSEGSQPSRALRRAPSCASMDCVLAPPAEFLADIEVVFEVSDLAAEPSSGSAPASWFCPPEA
jgi:hypothetical protein